LTANALKLTQVGPSLHADRGSPDRPGRSIPESRRLPLRYARHHARAAAPCL